MPVNESLYLCDMEMKRKSFLATSLAAFLLATVSSSAGTVIEGFRQMYFVSGIPVDGSPVNSSSSDVKFQISFALPLLHDVGGVRGLDVKVGYTQKSVWYLYADSSPFKDNTYVPGLYFDVPVADRNSSLLCGIEHRSNGRADSYSRSVNYVFGEYSHSFRFGLTLCANARMGFGWYNDDLTQDIFNRFYGYATLGALYETGRFSALVSATPSFAPFVLSRTAELSFRIGEKGMYHLFLQYHHGYDECFSDCIYGSVPGHNLRLGILITPSGANRLSR